MALFNCKVGGAEGSSFPSPVRFTLSESLSGANDSTTGTGSVTIPAGVFKRVLVHDCSAKQGSTTLARDTIVTLDATKTLSISVSRWTGAGTSASGYADLYVD